MQTPYLPLINPSLQQLLSDIKFDSPDLPGGAPLCIVTGELKFYFKSPVGNSTTRTFQILCDSLLWDLDAQKVYYHAKTPLLYDKFK